MLPFLASTLVYAGLLTLYIPAPEGLKERRATAVENLAHIKASLAVGLLLLSVFFVTSAFGFLQADNRILALLALSNESSRSSLWLLQILTNSFVHVDVVHVLGNVAAIGIASAYERRVGTKRFVMVLMVGALASAPSVFFYSEPTVSCGISGGVFALAAAYFTDHKDLAAKEWLQAILMFAVLMVMFSFYGEIRAPSGMQSQFQVDYVGHIFGAIAGITYVRVKLLA